jgi:MarR family transcriptional regulator for hemolysin
VINNYYAIYFGMAPSQTTIHAEFGFLMRRIVRLWRREADQALADHGLSEATAVPLLVLSRWGKCARQGVLAEEMGIEGPSLVRLIDLLQAEGLVERREDPTDRRAKMLHLTAIGETKADEIDRVLRRVRAYLLKDISSEDLAVTFEALRSIERRAGMLRAAAVPKTT